MSDKKNNRKNAKAELSADDIIKQEQNRTDYWDSLRKKRMNKKISLEDLSLKTKINIRYFEMIEKGDFSTLPETYIRLFLKTYARELGFDFEEILSHAPNNIQKKPKVPVIKLNNKNEPSPFTYKRKKKKNPFLLISGIIIVIAAIIVFQYYENYDFLTFKPSLTDTLSQTTVISEPEQINIPNEMIPLDTRSNVTLTLPYVLEILPEENLIYLLQVGNERSRENLIQKNINHSITINSSFKLKIFQPDKCRIILNGQTLPVTTNKPVIIEVNDMGQVSLFGSTL